MRAALLLVVASCSLQTSSTFTGPRPTNERGASPVAGPRPPDPPPTVLAGGVTRDWNDVLQFPVVTAPVDPWIGVAGTAPAAYPVDATQWSLQDESIPCTAARDHCLPYLAWMWTPERTLRVSTGQAQPVIYGQRGIMPSSFAGHDETKEYVAFRTVPATKKNIAVGTRVLAYPKDPLPPARTTSYDKWTVGTIERIDWDFGFIYLTDVEGPFFLTATRVAVLQYTPTEGVTVIGSRPRDQLAVSPAELFLP